MVVTTRKREELSVDVPASVQAFSGAAIEKSMTRNVADLYATVPNLYFSPIVISPARDYTTLVIRGVGAQSTGQPAVATVVDGIYQPALAFDTNFLDVESVEVLKGPQGTIFGRNTKGRVLNINLRKPGDVMRTRASAMVDNFGTFAATARMSGPLTETLSVGASFAASHTDRYLTNPTLGGVSADRSRSFAARAALRYRPTDRLDINLSVDASTTRGLQGLPGIYLPHRDYQVLSSFQVDAIAKSVGGSLNVAYDTGSLTFMSLTGYRRLTSDTPYDFAGGPVTGVSYSDEYGDLRRNLSVLSQEFRLSGTGLGDRLDWLVGLYGYRERNLEERPLSLAFGTSYIQLIQTQRLINKGIAIFAGATYEIVPRLSLDVGLRHGSESVDSRWYHRAVIPGIFSADEGGRDSISSDYVTPSASLVFKIAPSASIYARYATGQRSGGFPLAPRHRPTSRTATSGRKTSRSGPRGRSPTAS